MSGRAAVFVDRDGTLIEDVGYIADPGLVRLVPGAAESLRALRKAGFRLVLVSNQSGIGRGYFTESQARHVHERVVAELQGAGATLDGFRYCPHAPDAGCDCRKPLPGMLLDAARELRLDLARSFMIGDTAADVEAGRAAGCRTIAIAGTGAAPREADYVAVDWPDAVARIAAWRAEAA